MYIEAEVFQFQQQFSDNNKIQWVANFESLAAWEAWKAWEAKLHVDEEHMEDVQKNAHVLFEKAASAIYQEAK